MLTYVEGGESYYATALSPNINLQSYFPQVVGTPSEPLLLYYVYRRLLYLNVGGSPLWSPICQIAPDQVIQILPQPLLSVVIAQLQAPPADADCLRLVTMLARGF